MSESILPAISPGRRRKDSAARGVMAVLTLVALVPLVLVIYYLLYKGLKAFGSDFFSTDPTGDRSAWTIAELAEPLDFRGVSCPSTVTIQFTHTSRPEPWGCVSGPYACGSSC